MSVSVFIMCYIICVFVSISIKQYSGYYIDYAYRDMGSTVWGTELAIVILLTVLDVSIIREADLS